jgi:hypothetical protein
MSASHTARVSSWRRFESSCLRLCPSATLLWGWNAKTVTSTVQRTRFARKSPAEAVPMRSYCRALYLAALVAAGRRISLACRRRLASALVALLSAAGTLTAGRLLRLLAAWPPAAGGFPWPVVDGWLPLWLPCCPAPAPCFSLPWPLAAGGLPWPVVEGRLPLWLPCRRSALLSARDAERRAVLFLTKSPSPPVRSQGAWGHPSHEAPRPGRERKKQASRRGNANG